MVLCVLPSGVTAREIPNQLLAVLMGHDVDITAEVTKVDRKGGGLRSRETQWTFHLLIERVHHGEDAAKGVVAGGSVRAVAQTRRLARGTVGSTGHRADFGGTNGLPQVGDRVRLHARWQDDQLVPALPNGFRRPGTSIVFVAAEDEYRSEKTMPLLAKALGERPGITAGVVTPAVAAAQNAEAPAAAGQDLTDTLIYAHVCVMYLRFSRDEDLAEALIDFARSGRPVAGFRTSTHAFAFPADHRLAPFNDRFGEQVFGAPWRTHHGHSSRTRVTLQPGAPKDHPILRGLTDALSGEEAIIVRSWLYEVEPLGPGCTVLLRGEAIASERDGGDGRSQPILWIREGGPALEDPDASRRGTPPRRMAFTTLGHPEDFEHPVIRALAERMILWAAGDLP